MATTLDNPVGSENITRGFALATQSSHLRARFRPYVYRGDNTDTLTPPFDRPTLRKMRGTVHPNWCYCTPCFKRNMGTKSD